MKVLRDNKESLMAVLEAFVYDPLINWRLMQTEVEARRVEGLDISGLDESTSSLAQIQRQTPIVPLSWRRWPLIPRLQHES